MSINYVRRQVIEKRKKTKQNIFLQSAILLISALALFAVHAAEARGFQCPHAPCLSIISYSLNPYCRKLRFTGAFLEHSDYQNGFILEGNYSKKNLETGVQLHNELHNVYKSMDVKRSLLKGSNGSIDVSGVVANIIPAGTTFDEAEEILRIAGFKVYPGPWSQYAPNGSSVFAEISPFEQGNTWRINLIVYLTPKFKNKYDFVETLSANFTLATL